MYLTNQHKYILSHLSDTGSMNIKGKPWENSKLYRHFDNTTQNPVATVFKNIGKYANFQQVNINLMQFNTFSTYVDLRSLTISINDNSRGYLRVTYGQGYNSYSETLISNLPNSNVVPENGKHLEIENKFKDAESPIMGQITLEPKSSDEDSLDCDKNSFRGIVILTYKIANRLAVSDKVATCQIYFLPNPSLNIISIDNDTNFIMDKNTGTLTFPDPTKLYSSALKNEISDGKYSIPFSFTQSFGERNTYIENSNAEMTPNQLEIIKKNHEAYQKTA